MARKRKYGENVTEEATVGIDLNDAGSAEVLPIAEIQVEPEYQRDLRYELVQKIAKGYDIVKAGPILVNKRKDGTLWCVDGQHRMAGASQAGEEEIFAHVVHGLTLAEEAELRLARNDRMSDTIYEKFRTRLVMGDEQAHAICEVARQQHTRINLTPDVNHGINGISAAETLYEAGDGHGLWLGRVLSVLNETFSNDDIRVNGGLGGHVLGTNMMKSVAWFIDRHNVGIPGGISMAEFQNRMRQYGDEEIGRLARNHKAINGGAMWVNYYRALVGIWNHGRQEKNKIEARTIGSITELGADHGARRPARP